MFWSTIDFPKLTELLLPTFLRKSKMLAYMAALVAPLRIISEETLYKMQHNGARIYLEKVLNEQYNVPTYNRQDHENTKLIYIDDVPQDQELFIFQDYESESSYIEDDGTDSEDDLFLDGDEENQTGYGWIIYIPDTISFDEIKLRALVDSYRYIGYKYTIEIYSI